MSHAVVYHAGGLGDFVLSLPALRRLTETHSDAAWHYWGPRDRLALMPGWRTVPAALARAGHSLWGTCPEPAAARWLSGAERVVAFAARTPPWLPAPPRGLLVRSFPDGAEATGEWVPRFQARQLGAAGVSPPSGSWLQKWREFVLSGRARNSNRVLLHPGSGDRAKNLPMSTWRQAASALCAGRGWTVRALLGPVEQERGDGLSEWGVERRTCSGLEELLDEVAGAALLLGNDSGVSHLAAALGIPSVVVFGPSNPSLWRPLGRSAAVVVPSLPCAPCCVAPPVRCSHRSCLADLPSAAIVSAALQLLDHRTNRRPGNG